MGARNVLQGEHLLVENFSPAQGQALIHCKDVLENREGLGFICPWFLKKCLYSFIWDLGKKTWKKNEAKTGVDIPNLGRGKSLSFSH